VGNSAPGFFVRGFLVRFTFVAGFDPGLMISTTILPLAMATASLMHFNPQFNFLVISFLLMIAITFSSSFYNLYLITQMTTSYMILPGINSNPLVETTGGSVGAGRVESGLFTALSKYSFSTFSGFAIYRLNSLQSLSTPSTTMV